MILDTLLLPLLINAACASFDGGAFLQCREFPGFQGETITMPETGPARYLAGEYPTVQSFLLAGAVEVAVLTAVSYGLQRIGWKQWWIPQITVAAYHGYLGVENIRAHRKYIQQKPE